MPAISVTYIGGPTAMLTVGGVRFLIDPTFDGPGEYPIGERTLVKRQGPALTPEQIGPVDAVLLSHDQHPDNLDRRGREVLAAAPLALSTPAAEQRLGAPVRGLDPWACTPVRGAGGTVTVTAVPARHGPAGSEEQVGPVTGFAIAGGEGESVYVSGDNASVEVVAAIAERLGPFTHAVLFAGAARTALAGGQPLTLTATDAVQAVRLLGEPDTVAVHFEGWEHFSEGSDALRGAFTAAGLAQRLCVPSPGETLRL
ncbi:MAG TPA: MBL fold metallo-hydrolase [Solirubrobacteraceae bacterium]|nr:MBL fold metallo-hydrolase [Solirubrobacteraceae bacterium]